MTVQFNFKKSQSSYHLLSKIDQRSGKNRNLLQGKAEQICSYHEYKTSLIV